MKITMEKCKVLVFCEFLLSFFSSIFLSCKNWHLYQIIEIYIKKFILCSWTYYFRGLIPEPYVDSLLNRLLWWSFGHTCAWAQCSVIDWKTELHNGWMICLSQWFSNFLISGLTYILKNYWGLQNVISVDIYCFRN